MKFPCPFCGYVALLAWHYGYMEPNPWCIECSCGACGPWAKTESDAEEAWNQRVKI